MRALCCSSRAAGFFDSFPMPVQGKNDEIADAHQALFGCAANSGRFSVRATQMDCGATFWRFRDGRLFDV
jgi:hypothetical protein